MNAPAASAPYLLADLSGVRLAVPVGSVSEILRSVALTIVPGSPNTIEGAINLRGQLVPVIDLQSRLALPRNDNEPSDYLIVFALASRLVAARFQAVDDVEMIDVSTIAVPSAVSPALASFDGFAGVAARPDGALVIFDPGAFLTEAELAQAEVAIAGRS